MVEICIIWYCNNFKTLTVHGMNNMKVAYIQLNLQKWAVVQFSSVAIPKFRL